MSLTAIAAEFASSTEFQTRYGSLTNQQFVEQLYLFCLNRAGEPAGVQNWVNALNGGMSRAQVLLEFSESPEHVALTRSLWLGGVQVTDAGAGATQVIPALDGGKAGGLDADGALVLPGMSDEPEVGDAWVLPMALTLKDGSAGEQVLPGLIEDGFVLDGVSAIVAGSHGDAQVLPAVPEGFDDVAPGHGLFAQQMAITLAGTDLPAAAMDGDRGHAPWSHGGDFDLLAG